MTHWWTVQHLHDFIDKTPGELVEIVDNKGDGTYVSYVIKYYEDQKKINDRDKFYWLKKFNITKEFDTIENWIKRYATEQEIEDYKIKIDAKKYNL